MPLRRISTLALLGLVVVPSLAIYAMSSGLAERVRELFAQERYAELIAELDALGESELSDEERFSLLASRLRVAKLRADAEAAREAARLLDRWAETASADYVARITAERIVALQIAELEHADRRLDAALRHWEQHEDLLLARDRYLELFTILLADDIHLSAPFERMWRNLVLADTPREQLLPLGERLLGGGAGRRGLPWQIYARTQDAQRLRRSVAQELLRLSPPDWLRALAEFRLGELAQELGEPAEAVAHFEAAVAAARAEDSAAAADARRRLEQLRAPSLDLSGNALHRPSSEPILNVGFANLRAVRVRVRQLDPVADLVLDAGSLQDRNAPFYRDASGDKRFERQYDVSAKEPYRSHIETIHLDALAPGLYLCEAFGEARSGDLPVTPARFVLQISRLGLIVQPLWGASGHEIDLWLIDMESGAPQPGVSLSIRYATENASTAVWQRADARTDELGRVRLRRLPPFVRGLLVAGQQGEQPIFFHGFNLVSQTRAQERDVLAHILTDRPLYRPGETVHFSAVLRERDLSARSLAPPKLGEQLELVVVGADGNEFHRATLVLDAEGFVESEWRIPDDVALGQASLQLGWADGRGVFHHDTIQIEEVRLPEFRVRVVPLIERALVAGDSVQVEVSAEYLWGAPVHGEVEMVLQRRPRWQLYPQPLPFVRSQSKIAPWPQWQPLEEIARDQLSLDDEGKARWAFRSREEEGQFEYIVEARVVDESRREESSQTTLAIGNSEFLATLRPSRWCVGPGDEIELTLRVEDLNGRGIAATGEVTIHHGAPEERQLERRHLASDAQGDGKLRFRAERPGSYRFVFQCEDRRGNVVRAETALWCADPKQRVIVEASGGLTLVAERDAFGGEAPARVLIVSDRPDAWVHLTRAHGAGVESEILQLNGSVHLLSIPLDDMHRPRFHLRALSAHDYRVQSADLTVEAPAASKRLQVELSFDRERYRPGDLAQLRLRAHDAAGKPAQAPFRLAVIDAALLEVVPRNLVEPVELFHGFWTMPAPRALISGQVSGGYRQEGKERRDLEVGYEDEDGLPSPSALAESNELLAKAGRSADTAVSLQAKTEHAPLELRTDFRSTALWRTLVRPNARGEAVIELPLPDSLTEWNALAVGIDAQTRCGVAETTARTRKDLSVRLAHARVLRERDRMLLTAIVHNDAPREARVTVRLSASALELDRGEQLLSVPAGGTASAHWWAQVPAGAATLRLVRDEDSGRLSVWPERSRIRIEALSADESDGFERMVELHPYGTPIRVTAAGRFTADGELRLALPKQRVPSAERATITLSPSVLSACIDALPYLASYPYGCIEQTLSRFVPALAVRQVARALGVDSARIDADLDAKIQRGLARLDELQSPDGGFGWWAGASIDPYMTAYALLALGEAESAGVRVDAGVLSRARAALRAQLPQLESRPDDLCYALLALLALDEDETIARFAQQLVDARAELNDAARALLALHEAERGRSENAQLLVGMLRNTAVRESKLGTVHWGERANYWWRWQGAVESSSFALRALLRVAPDAPEIDAAAQWLLAQREGARWKSTRETAHAIFALTRYAKARGELDAEFTVVASLGEHEIARMEVTPERILDAGATIVVDPALLTDGANRIALRFVGEGRCYASASVEGYTAEDRPQPTAHRVEVRRELFQLLPTRTLGGSIRYLEAPYAESDTLQSNARLRVRLTLNVPVDLEYVAIEDPRAAGFEPVETLSGWQHDGSLHLRREQREDRTAFFVGFLPQGEHRIEYDLRAETPGRFHAMPTMAYAMYIPQISATSELQSLQIAQSQLEPTPRP